MSGSQGWPIPTDALGVFKAQEKRLTQEERRPRITKASDIMGPGLGPYAVEMLNLDSETAAFNGFWYVPLDAIGSPDTTKAWMGMTIADTAHGGTQIMWTFEGADAPHVAMQRGFEHAITGGTRFYSTWQEFGGSGTPPDPPTTWQAFVEATPVVFTGIMKNAALVTPANGGKAQYRKMTPTLVKLSGYLEHPSNATYFSTTYQPVVWLPADHRPTDQSNFNYQYFNAPTNLVQETARLRFDAVSGQLAARSVTTSDRFAGVYLDGIIIDLKAAN